MKLRHIISYSLQLFVPETVITAFERRSPPLRVAPTTPVLSPNDSRTASVRLSQKIEKSSH